MIDKRKEAGRYLLFFLVPWVLTIAHLSYAQAQLPAVNLGETNFEDAFGSPGWLIEEFPETYVAGEVRDANGKKLPGRNHVTTESTTTHVAFISDKRVLGGWVAAEVLQPLVDLDVHLNEGTTERVRGFGDLTIGPGLQWAPRRVGNGVFVHRLVADVTLPTGTYSDRRPVNIGNHFVAADPYYAITYERERAEVSIRAHYLWNSSNNDPFVGFGIRSIQSGQAIHANFATSYKLHSGVRLGFNGYWLQQLTNHKIDDVGILNSREQAVGLGPGLQFAGQGIWFRVNAYMETDVRNRPSGVKVTIRISKAIQLCNSDSNRNASSGSPKEEE